MNEVKANSLTDGQLVYIHHVVLSFCDALALRFKA